MPMKTKAEAIGRSKKAAVIRLRRALWCVSAVSIRCDRLLAELHLSARYEHAVRQHHHERGYEEPRSRRQRPHKQEEGRDVALGPRPEANAQVIVDRVDLEGEIGLEEDVADDEAPDDEAQDELHVREAFVGVTLDGRAEEGCRAGFRGYDGGHRGPPRHATPAERIVIQAFLPPPRIEPDGRNGDEVKEDDESVDQKPPFRCSIPPFRPGPSSIVGRLPFATRLHAQCVAYLVTSLMRLKRFAGAASRDGDCHWASTLMQEVAAGPMNGTCQ